LVFLRESFTTVSGDNYFVSSEESVGSRVPNAHVGVQTAKYDCFRAFSLVQASQKRV
jgi:hypothetical protein